MIKPQYLNLLNSSFLLWINNHILKRGQGFINTSSLFYPINTRYNNYYTYSAPFQQIVSDFSINNANIPTGIYVNGSYLLKGQSGFVDINYDRAEVYFNSNVNRTVSGNYALKDINVLYSNFSEQKLLFDTKFALRSKYPQNYTGLNKEEVTYPCIYVKSEAGGNEPLAFGGLDDSITHFGVYMFCESQYQLDALKSIIADSRHEYIPLFTTGEMPYNLLGGFNNNINFNYDVASSGKVSNGSGILITDVNITNFRREVYGDFSKLNPDIYWAIADFTVSKPRYPRLG